MNIILIEKIFNKTINETQLLLIILLYNTVFDYINNYCFVCKETWYYILYSFDFLKIIFVNEKTYKINSRVQNYNILLLFKKYYEIYLNNYDTNI